MRCAEAVAVSWEPEPVVLLGSSAAVRRLRDDLCAAAPARCVLVEGEPGLDFEQVASAMHRRSGRPGQCLRLATSDGDNPAAVERALAGARGGTLFLGELQELSSDVQRRLVLTAGDAADEASASTRTTLIACRSATADGRAYRGVRRDLARRFSVVRIHVPALRTRIEDLPLIARTLVDGTCADAGIEPKTLSEAALMLVAAMPWRGNMPELRRVLAAVVQTVQAKEIELADVLAHLRVEAAVAHEAPAQTLRAARRQFEREYIQAVLHHHGGRVGDAARVLGIQRTNLYRKARQLGISVTRPEHA